MAAPLVVIGFAEALPSPEVAWSLVDAGFRVAAFARKGRKSGLRHSRYVTVFEITAPETDCTAARADLATVVNNSCAHGNNRDLVLFPLDDVALWLCAQQSLSSKWVLAGPSAAGMRLALDKSVQVEAAGEADLP